MGEAHEHSFPVQPPAGSLLSPGPCTCGKTYARAHAERQLAKAQAAMEATEGGERDSDPLVRVIGQVDDGIAALPVAVGTDHGRVTIGCGAIRWRLGTEQADELSALLIAALWQAERDAASNG